MFMCREVKVAVVGQQADRSSPSSPTVMESTRCRRLPWRIDAILMFNYL